MNKEDFDKLYGKNTYDEAQVDTLDILEPSSPE